MAIGRFEGLPLIGLCSYVLVVIVLLAGAQTESKNLVRVQACRNGAGGCVASTICSVPTFQLRDDGCPSDLVCCPVPTITQEHFNVVSAAKSYTTTTNEPESSYSDEEIVTEIIVDDVGSERQNHHFLAVTEHPKIEQHSIAAATYVTNELELPADADRMMPWVASIYSTHQCCNGALISRNAVLTVNTCWKKCQGKSTSWTVRLGGWYSTSTGVFNNQSVLKIRRPLRSKDSQKLKGNYFALLQLDRDVAIDGSICPIGLPLATDSLNGEIVNLLYTGKGNLTNQKSTIKTIQLMELEWQQCQPANRIKSHRKYLCTVPKDREYRTWLSRGKFGSPVVAEVTSDSGRHYTLLGLIAKKKVHAGFTVLTKVSFFRSWIDTALQSTWE